MLRGRCCMEVMEVLLVLRVWVVELLLLLREADLGEIDRRAPRPWRRQESRGSVPTTALLIVSCVRTHHDILECVEKPHWVAVRWPNGHLPDSGLTDVGSSSARRRLRRCGLG